MKTDKEIANIYINFRDTLLPQFNMVQDLEKQFTSGINIFNKKKQHEKVFKVYEGYSQVVYHSWSAIYTGNEFDIVIKDIQALKENKPIYATTQISNLAQQFFFSLYFSIITVMGYYEGAHKDINSVNTFRYACIKYMEDKMVELDKLVKIYR